MISYSYSLLALLTMSSTLLPMLKMTPLSSSKFFVDATGTGTAAAAATAVMTVVGNCNGTVLFPL